MPNVLEKFTKNKPVFYGTLGVVAVATIIYYRHKQAAASAAPAATGAPDSGDPCDPSSSAYDPSACAQMQGSYVGDPYGGGSYGSGYYGNGNPPPSGPTGPDLSTKEAWISEAENVLPNGHSATVRNALLGVLGGLTVSSEERDIFLEAVGALGDPPGGYPKPIKVKDTKGHPGPGDVTVPNVKGDTFDNAQKKITSVGLQVHKNQPDIHIVTSESPSAGSKVKKGSTVTVGGHK